MATDNKKARLVRTLLMAEDENDPSGLCAHYHLDC